MTLVGNTQVTAQRHIISRILPLLIYGLLRCAESFTIEKSHRRYDGQNRYRDVLLANWDGFKLGQFMFVEAVHRFANASSILPVVAACVEQTFAEFAVLKFLSVKNLNLVEAAAISIADTNSESLSHVLNGCTPAGKGFDNGMKELLYHVSMVVNHSPVRAYFHLHSLLTHTYTFLNFLPFILRRPFGRGTSMQ